MIENVLKLHKHTHIYIYIYNLDRYVDKYIPNRMKLTYSLNNCCRLLQVRTLSFCLLILLWRICFAYQMKRVKPTLSLKV